MANELTQTPRWYLSPFNLLIDGWNDRVLNYNSSDVLPPFNLWLKISGDKITLTPQVEKYAVNIYFGDNSINPNWISQTQISIIINGQPANYYILLDTAKTGFDAVSFWYFERISKQMDGAMEVILRLDVWQSFSHLMREAIGKWIYENAFWNDPIHTPLINRYSGAVCEATKYLPDPLLDFSNIPPVLFTYPVNSMRINLSANDKDAVIRYPEMRNDYVTNISVKSVANTQTLKTLCLYAIFNIPNIPPYLAKGTKFIPLKTPDKNLLYAIPLSDLNWDGGIMKSLPSFFNITDVSDTKNGNLVRTYLSVNSNQTTPITNVWDYCNSGSYLIVESSQPHTNTMCSGMAQIDAIRNLMPDNFAGLFVLPNPFARGQYAQLMDFIFYWLFLTASTQDTETETISNAQNPIRPSWKDWLNPFYNWQTTSISSKGDIYGDYDEYMRISYMTKYDHTTGSVTYNGLLRGETADIITAIHPEWDEVISGTIFQFPFARHMLSGGFSPNSGGSIALTAKEELGVLDSVSEEYFYIISKSPLYKSELFTPISASPAGIFLRDGDYFKLDENGAKIVWLNLPYVGTQYLSFGGSIPCASSSYAAYVQNNRISMDSGLNWARASAYKSEIMNNRASGISALSSMVGMASSAANPSSSVTDAMTFSMSATGGYKLGYNTTNATGGSGFGGVGGLLSNYLNTLNENEMAGYAYANNERQRAVAFAQSFAASSSIPVQSADADTEAAYWYINNAINSNVSFKEGMVGVRVPKGEYFNNALTIIKNFGYYWNFRDKCAWDVFTDYSDKVVYLDAVFDDFVIKAALQKQSREIITAFKTFLGNGIRIWPPNNPAA